MCVRLLFEQSVFIPHQSSFLNFRALEIREKTEEKQKVIQKRIEEEREKQHEANEAAVEESNRRGEMMIRQHSAQLKNIAQNQRLAEQRQAEEIEKAKIQAILKEAEKESRAKASIANISNSEAIQVGMFYPWCWVFMLIEYAYVIRCCSLFFAP